MSTAEATDGTTTSSSVSETISLVALPSLSIAGAGAHEQHDYELAFTVTLEGTRSGEVSIDYATADGTATAGADYVAATGSLTFGSAAIATDHPGGLAGRRQPGRGGRDLYGDAE